MRDNVTDRPAFAERRPVDLLRCRLQDISGGRLVGPGADAAELVDGDPFDDRAGRLAHCEWVAFEACVLRCETVHQLGVGAKSRCGVPANDEVGLVATFVPLDFFDLQNEAAVATKVLAFALLASVPKRISSTCAITHTTSSTRSLGCSPSLVEVGRGRQRVAPDPQDAVAQRCSGTASKERRRHACYLRFTGGNRCE